METQANSGQNGPGEKELTRHRFCPLCGAGSKAVCHSRRAVFQAYGGGGQGKDFGNNTGNDFWARESVGNLGKGSPFSSAIDAS